MYSFVCAECIPTRRFHIPSTLKLFVIEPSVASTSGVFAQVLNFVGISYSNQSKPIYRKMRFLDAYCIYIIIGNIQSVH